MKLIRFPKLKGDKSTDRLNTSEYFIKYTLVKNSPSLLRYATIFDHRAPLVPFSISIKSFQDKKKLGQSFNQLHFEAQTNKSREMDENER